MTVNIVSRRIPKDMNVKVARDAIRQIKNDFTLQWLESYTDTEHPLKKLWGRTDVFATNQLFLLGHSLKKIKPINPKWINDAIEFIKGENRDKMRGTILEAFIASQFHNPPEKIVDLPVSSKNPGYDIQVKLSDGSEIYIQSKNNSALKNFENNERISVIEDIIISNLRARALNVIIHKVDDKDPTDDDWYQLRNQLPIVMQDTPNETGSGKEIEGGWYVGLRDMSGSISFLHPTKPTYNILLIIPFSQPEKNNLLSKINDACSVLKKKSIPDTEDSINLAMLCVPIEAPFALCSELAHQYFEENPEKRASGVLFYKSGPVVDIQNKRSFLAHAFHMVLRNDRRDWLEAHKAVLPIKFDIGIGKGVFSVDGIGIIDNNDIYNVIDAGPRKIRVDNQHFYQSGQINHLIRKTGTVSFDKYIGVKERVFYIDSDRLEKEATKDYIVDDRLLLL
jgi:hypothetical protein